MGLHWGRVVAPTGADKACNLGNLAIRQTPAECRHRELRGRRLRARGYRPAQDDGDDRSRIGSFNNWIAREGREHSLVPGTVRPVTGRASRSAVPSANLRRQSAI